MYPLIPPMQDRGFIHQPYGHQRSRRGRRIYHPSPSRLAPAAPSQRGRLFIKGKKVKQYPPPNPNPSGTAKSNAHRRHSRRSNVRQDNRTNARLRAKRPAKNQRAQPPKSAPAAKPPQQHPAENTHLREIKDLNCRSQPDKPACARLRPRQPAPGSGEPRKRLKLRSAMLNYVSCLGMTTPPTPPA